MIRKRDASLQFQLSAKMVQQRQYLETPNGFSPMWFYVAECGNRIANEWNCV